MRLQLIGKVIGTAMQKTAKVKVDRLVRHPLYDRVRTPQTSARGGGAPTHARALTDDDQRPSTHTRCDAVRRRRSCASPRTTSFTTSAPLPSSATLSALKSAHPSPSTSVRGVGYALARVWAAMLTLPPCVIATRWAAPVSRLSAAGNCEGGAQVCQPRPRADSAAQRSKPSGTSRPAFVTSSHDTRCDAHDAHAPMYRRNRTLFLHRQQPAGVHVYSLAAARCFCWKAASAAARRAWERRACSSYGPSRPPTATLKPFCCAASWKAYPCVPSVAWPSVDGGRVRQQPHAPPSPPRSAPARTSAVCREMPSKYTDSICAVCRLPPCKKWLHTCFCITSWLMGIMATLTEAWSARSATGACEERQGTPPHLRARDGPDHPPFDQVFKRRVQQMRGRALRTQAPVPRNASGPSPLQTHGSVDGRRRPARAAV